MGCTYIYKKIVAMTGAIKRCLDFMNNATKLMLRYVDDSVKRGISAMILKIAKRKYVQANIR